MLFNNEKNLNINILRMEKVISLFEKFTLNDGFIFKYLQEDSFNTQKCYCSTNKFKSLGIRPGYPVFLKDESHIYLCRLYEKPYLTDDIIEIDKSVNTPNNTNENFLSSLDKFSIYIHRSSPICKVKNIDVKIIFDTLDDLTFWHDKENEIITSLKNYIFKYFIISNGFEIDLGNFSNVQRFGIYKLLLKSDENDSDSCLGKVYGSTNIHIAGLSYKTKYELENKILPPLYGMETYEKRLMEVVNANKLVSKIKNNYLQPSKQVLLVGPTGCGKSSLVALIAQKTKSSIISIVDHHISQKEPGATESTIRTLFNNAFTCAKITGSCIINLDEISNLCPNRKYNSTHAQRAATQILLLLDEAQTIPGIIVIATTNKPENLDPSIRRHSRLETEIFIGPPTELQRQLIIENLILDLKLALVESDIKTLSHSIACMTPGYVGADLKQICQKISLIDKNQIMNIQDSLLAFWTNKFRDIISAMKPASLKGALGTVTVGQLSFDNLAGLDDIKKSLQMAVLWPLQHAESFQRMGISVPKGVLLYGPPGCAKTSLVKALISVGKFSLLSISAAELYSPYVGDAERLIVKLFERARQNSPCIIFIDEIDSLTGSRSVSNDSNSDFQERILASLLTQMDGIGHQSKVADSNKIINPDDGVVVIGATNRPDMIDPALLRPGRFDKHIYVPPPNEESRLSILKLVTKKMPLADDVNLAYIASKSEYFSGADVKNICTEAALLALSEDGMDVKVIKNVHFVNALSNSRPSLCKSQIMKYTSKIF